MSKLPSSLIIPTYTTQNPTLTKLGYLKGTIGNTPFQHAAAWLECHAGLLAYRAMAALAAHHQEEFSLAAEERPLFLGPTFLLRQGEEKQLLSWRVVPENVGNRLENTANGFFVMDIERVNNSGQGSFNPNGSSRLYLRLDSMVRHLLRDFDGKGNTGLSENFVGAFDVGASFAKVATTHFPANELEAGDHYDNSMKQSADMQRAAGYKHWNQASPFNWRYIAPTKKDEAGNPLSVSEDQSVAAEFFVSNLARVPFVGQKKLYTALLAGDAVPGLDKLIIDTLNDAEIVANSVLESLMMPEDKLNDGFSHALIQAAYEDLEPSEPWHITDEAVLKVYQAQKLYLQETAEKQLKIVELCKASKACLLAYLLQNLTASDEFVPVLMSPGQFIAAKPETVIQSVKESLGVEVSKYEKLIDSISTVVKNLNVPEKAMNPSTAKAEGLLRAVKVSSCVMRGTMRRFLRASSSQEEYAEKIIELLKLARPAVRKATIATAVEVLHANENAKQPRSPTGYLSPTPMGSFKGIFSAPESGGNKDQVPVDVPTVTLTGQ